MGLIAAPQAKFGTHPNANGFAITLWENLCYLKSYSRALDESIPAPGVPTVDVSHFDGPRVTVVKSPMASGPSTTNAISKDGGDAHDIAQDGQMIGVVELPHGRMHTGVVITQSKDQATYDSSGNRSTLEEPLPGVAFDFHLAADGQIEVYGRFDPLALLQTPWTTQSASHDWTGQNQSECMSIAQGGSDGPEGSNPGAVMSGIGQGAAAGVNIDLAQYFTCDTGQCCARNINPCGCEVSAATTDKATGAVVDHIGGNGRDPHSGVMFGTTGIGWLDDAIEEGEKIVNDGVEKLDELKEVVKEEVKERGKDLVDGVKKIGEAVTDFTKDNIGSVLRSAGVDEGVVQTIETIIAFVGTVQTEVGEALARELLDTVMGLAKVLTTTPAERVKEGIENLKVMMEFVGGMKDMTSEDWEDLFESGLTEAFKALANTDMTPEEFGDALIHPCFGTDAGTKRTAKAFAVVGVIVIGAVIAYFTGGESKAAKAEQGAGKLIEKVSELARNCFLAGTLVWVLKDGADELDAERALLLGEPIEKWCVLVPIERIKRRDIVLTRPASDPDASLCFEPVEYTHTSITDEIVELTVTDSSSRASGTIYVTPGHAFWVTDTASSKAPLVDFSDEDFEETMSHVVNEEGNTVFAQRGWVFAADLERGFELSTANRASPVITGTRTILCPGTKTYNFSVSTAHTYFVSSGQADAQGPAVWAHNNNKKKGAPGQKHTHGNPGHTPNPEHQNPAIKKKKQEERNKKKQKQKQCESDLQKAIDDEWEKMPQTEKNIWKTKSDFEKHRRENPKGE